MTIQEAMDLLDEMKPNMMSRKLKVKFLSEIEQLIHWEIVRKHEGAEDVQMPEYTEYSDPGTVLVIPDPYSMLYVYWLMSKVDTQNQEDGRYNVDRALFDNAYQTMSDWYTREHMPIMRNRELSI